MPTEATQLLALVADGDQEAGARLTPIVYHELRALAAGFMSARGNGVGVIQPTALVHEAFLKLVDRGTADYKSQTHFFATAAAAMRQALIDHARGERRQKRGGGLPRVTLVDDPDLSHHDQVDMIELNDALSELAELDPRAARAVELRFFGGLTVPQAAEVLAVSERTLRNDWSMARAWLRTRLSGGEILETA